MDDNDNQIHIGLDLYEHYIKCVVNYGEAEDILFVHLLDKIKGKIMKLKSIIFILIITLFWSISNGNEKTEFGLSFSSAVYNKFQLVDNGLKISGNLNLKYNMTSRWFLFGSLGLAYQNLNYDPGSLVYYFPEENQYNQLKYIKYEFNNLEIPVELNLNYNFIQNEKFDAFFSLGVSYHFVALNNKDMKYTWEYDVDRISPINGDWDGFFHLNDDNIFHSYDLGIGIVLPVKEKSIMVKYQLSGENRVGGGRANKITIGYLF